MYKKLAFGSYHRDRDIHSLGIAFVGNAYVRCYHWSKTRSLGMSNGMSDETCFRKRSNTFRFRKL